MNDDPSDILARAQHRGSFGRRQVEGVRVIPARTSGNVVATP